jgi:hypothetical protein
VTTWLRLTAIVFVLALTTAPNAGAAEEHSLFGINAWGVLDNGASFAPLRDSRIHAYRVVFPWSWAEPQPGVPYDFTQHERLVAAAARLGIRVRPVLIDSPTWVAPRLSEPPEPGYEMQRFEQFVAAAARRFGVGGTFWQEHPELPDLPIKHWEVWNEPNYPAFWYHDRAPSAGGYRLLLAAAKRGLMVDPMSRTIFGGLAYGQAGVDPLRYMRAFLSARGARCLFDEMGIHPYSSTARLALRDVQRMRALLDRAGRKEAGLWLTEYGWSTGGDLRNPLHVTEARQQGNLLRLTRALVRRRNELHIDGIYWFALQDAPSDAGDKSWWGWGTGLLRQDGSAKPAFDAYLDLARTAPNPIPDEAGPCRAHPH